jgi:hypothetical protein
MGLGLLKYAGIVEVYRKKARGASVYKSKEALFLKSASGGLPGLHRYHSGNVSALRVALGRSGRSTVS